MFDLLAQAHTLQEEEKPIRNGITVKTTRATRWQNLSVEISSYT